MAIWSVMAAVFHNPRAGVSSKENTASASIPTKSGTMLLSHTPAYAINVAVLNEASPLPFLLTRRCGAPPLVDP